MYIQTAGFNIKISFQQSDKLVAGSRLKSDILNLVKAFILKRKPKKVDFNIEFIADINIYINKKTQQGFAPLYRLINSTTLITNYSISLDQLNTILMYIISQLLLKNKGFLIHASAIRIDGQNLIFIGEENAGKTTIVKLLKAIGKPLADDNLIIRPADSKHYFYQSPLIERNQYKKTNKKFLIDNIFILKKSADYKIEKIKNKSSLINLLTKTICWNSFETVKKELFIKKNLNPVIDFVSGQEFYNLYFGKNKNKLEKAVKTFLSTRF